MRCRFRTADATRRGAAAVEFAIVLPVALTFVFALIEFGRLVMVGNVLTSCAREAVRKGAVPGGSNADIQAAVETYLDAAGIARGNLAMTVKVNGTEADASTAGKGDRITLSLGVPFNSVSWLPTIWSDENGQKNWGLRNGAGSSGGALIRGVAVMHHE